MSSDAVIKELAVRKAEIEKELELLFKANMKITDWDVPEGDDSEAADIILKIMDKKIQELRADVKAGKYENY
ncbi:hypothetical protein [Sulfurimonas paralvinellae]|uniref:Uncharacterized protein n=1 Tax=Sulfurimonas paralvinellae TaxID=317658 RepID=A0A7M1B7L4_9BACT|nr:hypothetical protein [Sulfurimonas paralvinellae]QOP45486.1 hypothetical protein FM071_03995 [Sulfurimonas paralvinellae]